LILSLAGSVDSSIYCNEKKMKRGAVIWFAICALVLIGYLTASQWTIRHETFTFYDPSRNNRPVAVGVAVRRDKELRAIAGAAPLPVVILSHGNTVRFTEYSFLANILAARGYLVLSIQHETVNDGPLVTKAGEPYVGRQPVYERGVANILFAIDKLKPIEAAADYDHLTLIGHSNGGDISMYFAKLHPELVKEIVTLDSLRVPFITDGKFRILSFRSKDPNFEPDPGVVPDAEACEKSGIKVVQTEFRHADLSDRGPERAKTMVVAMLDKFLGDSTPIRRFVPEMVEPDPEPNMFGLGLAATADGRR
jgi:pimeloyl-ACP methyl ester carboxylesterase